MEKKGIICSQCGEMAYRTGNEEKEGWWPHLWVEYGCNGCGYAFYVTVEGTKSDEPDREG